MAESKEGGVRVERVVRLTLTEDEYKTMMTALHDYGHYCLCASNDLARVNSRANVGYDPLEGSRLAKVSGDRAFALKGKLQELWEA